MTKDVGTTSTRHGSASREARLKTALKANMSRRKAQARARREADGPTPQGAGHETTEPDPDEDGQQ